jgi:hypothetical protein
LRSYLQNNHQHQIISKTSPPVYNSMIQWHFLCNSHGSFLIVLFVNIYYAFYFSLENNWECHKIRVTHLHAFIRNSLGKRIGGPRPEIRSNPATVFYTSGASFPKWDCSKN